MAKIGLVSFARVARQVAEVALPRFRSKYSKHTFTQPSLLAVLCVMRYEDWTYCETAQLVPTAATTPQPSCCSILPAIRNRLISCARGLTRGKPLPPAHGAEPSAFLLYGDGLGNYLVYGGPHGSEVAPGTPVSWFKEGPVAAGRLWAWLWNRTALGGVKGSYDFTMIVRNGMPMPLPTPLQESVTP